MRNGNHSLNVFFSNNIFLGSFANINDMPNSNFPEFTFVGRSNVGKSSIINSVTKTKKLAKTSKTPGRTQSANLFKINNKLNILDLPGYGYAKISKDKRDRLSSLIESYIRNRINLVRVFVLIDCKVGIKYLDIEMLDSLVFFKKKFSIVLTKIDKCSPSCIKNQTISIETLMKNYKKNFDRIFVSSSKKNNGILDIQKNIFNLSK